MKEISDKLKLAMTYLGTDMNGKKSVRSIFITLILLIFFVNNIYLLKYGWEDVNMKMNAMKNITTIFIVALYTFVYLFYYKDFSLQILVIEEGIFKFPFAETDTRKEIMDTIRADLIRQNNVILYTFIVYIIIANSLPVFGVAFKMLTVKNLSGIVVENLPLNFPFYFPVNYKNIYFYIGVYIFQVSLIVIYAVTAYVCYSASLNSMQIVEKELSLLRLAIEEIDVYLRHHSMIFDSSFKISANEVDSKLDNYSDDQLMSLKCYLRYIVLSHQNINRKACLVNKGIQGVSFVYNFGVSMYLCAAVYFIVQNNDNFVFVLQESVVFCAVAVVLYLYCYNGEKITIESENVRNAVYEHSWLDKPLWCKKALLMMLKRTIRDVEMKPFGLFVLNLRNFLMTMNAAYSYYNLANNVIKK